MLEFKLPELGENITSGTVVKVSVSVGDSVKADQPLCEVETDKATIDVPSPASGVIKNISIKEGDEIKIGQTLMTIDESGAEKQTTAQAAESSAVEDEQSQTQRSDKDSSETKQRKQSTSTPSQAAPVAPISKIQNFVPTVAQKDVPAAPSVRRLARELGLDVSHVPGSGPGGRISKDDIKLFAKQIVLGRASSGTGGPAPRSLPDFTKFGQVERQAMNNVRKKTLDHLSYCWQTIPHVTQFGKADITELEKLRKKFSTDKKKLTITPFLLKIMADALKEFPQFNASIDPESKEIILKKYFNLGVAVDTDRGLLVPVIREVDKKDVFELTDDLNDAAERARNRKTGLDDLQGGSMTLTNLGGIGGTSFTPIVNWPEVAILGVSRGGLEPVYDKDNKAFAARFMLPLSLSYDHRLIDGADGARFLVWIINALEDSNRFKLTT
jgi:pyruvate dehydrogenase E2 component (dihydrolipoamide acetyltransferase)